MRLAHTYPSACRARIPNYATEREHIDHKINSCQLICAILADIDKKIDAARLLLHRSASLVERAPLNNKDAVANLYAPQTCVRAALNGMRKMRGLGLADGI